MTIEPTIKPEVRELAGRAAAELRRRGWHQGEYGEVDWNVDDETVGVQLRDCAVCVLGAINAATGGDPWLFHGDSHTKRYVRTQLVAAIMRELGTTTPKEVATWNDAPERTVDEVLAVLDGIAA